MGQIDEAMVKILEDFTAVGKERFNDQQKYNFRGIDDVCNELHPLMKRHGVYITTEVLDQKRELSKTTSGKDMHYSILTVKYTFHAKDGSKTDPIVTVGEGMDMADKASNKAMSAALKYALIQAFAIPTRDPKDSENPPDGAGAMSHERPGLKIKRPERTEQQPAPQDEQQPAQPDPDAWREVVTPQKKRMGDMSAVELATMEVTLSQRQELTENAEAYRQFALDGVRYYALQSPDMKLVGAIFNILEHDLRRPDEIAVFNATLERLQQQQQPQTTHA